MVDFLAEQFMFFLATTDARGGPDCSVRVGDPGFVVPVTRRTLVYPELRGNGVLASLGNILENPGLSMLFVDFEKDTIGLHVNGRGREATDAEVTGYRDAVAEGSTMMRRTVTWLAIDLECAYVHCSKHLPRLVRQPKKLDWSTDSGRSKGGDYFGAAAAHCEDRDA